MDPSPVHADPLAAVPDELDALADRPLAEHAEVFTRVHSALTTALATTAIDTPAATPTVATSLGATGPARPGQVSPGQGR
jgi:hypothetical protein